MWPSVYFAKVTVALRLKLLPTPVVAGTKYVIYMVEVYFVIYIIIEMCIVVFMYIIRCVVF